MCDSVAIIQNGRLIDVKQLKTVGDAAVPVSQTFFEVDNPEAALAQIGQGVIMEGGLAVDAVREEIAEPECQAGSCRD